MADAPAANPPAAAPVANANPPSVTPAASPPASPTPSKPAAAGSPPELSFDDPIEWVDNKGQVQRATYGQLIEAREKLSGMNIDQLNDLAAAMGNDPDATERVLRRQLEDIEKKKKPSTPPPDDRVGQLEAQVKTLSDQLAQSSRVTQSIEDQQTEAVIENLLGRAEAKQHMPYLCALPKVGAKVAMPAIKAAKAQCKAAGVEFTNQHLLHALANAETGHRYRLEPYGIDPAKIGTNGATGNAAVSAVNNGPGQRPEVVREPLDTAESLLRQRTGGQPTPQPTPVGSNVPEPGGATGGVPAGAAHGGNQRYNAGGLADKLRAQRAAGGGA